MVDFEFKKRYTLEDLLSIMALLRAPGGCPWDAAQTHESIKKNLIEETYEVIEAINKQDRDLLLEELGDLLMQVVFHAQMEQEKGSFTFEDVCDGICQKLVIRHPHVFGTAGAENVDQALSNWNAIKMQTKGQKTTGESMASVPRELPALMRGEKLQSKAAKVGFDWPDINGVLDKIDEESTELRQAVASGTKEQQAEELGDLMFSCVNAARFIGCDAEETMTAANDKFFSRFVKVEELARARDINMNEASLAELDALWDEVKKDM